MISMHLALTLMLIVAAVYADGLRVLNSHY